MACKELASLGSCDIGRAASVSGPPSLEKQQYCRHGGNGMVTVACAPCLVPLEFALFHREASLSVGGSNFEQFGCSLWQKREVQRSRAIV